MVRSDLTVKSCSLDGTDEWKTERNLYFDTGAKMRARLFALIGSILSMAGCVDPNAPIKTRAGNLSQSQVNAITQRCGGESGMVKIENDDLIIYPAKDISITGCVLKALQETGQTTLIRVENQRHDPPGN
jgi:hypothetical protein